MQPVLVSLNPLNTIAPHHVLAEFDYAHPVFGVLFDMVADYTQQFGKEENSLRAVVNGLEVLEDERDAAMRADALKIVTSSAGQALARRLRIGSIRK